jgi:hypothetical protein
MAAAPSSYGGYAPSSSASLPDAPVCKDFQNGRSAPPSPLLLACSLKSLVCRCRCVRGAQCRYKHEMLDSVPPAYCPPAQMSYMPSAYAAAPPLPEADAATSSSIAGTLLIQHHYLCFLVLVAAIVLHNACSQSHIFIFSLSSLRLCVSLHSHHTGVLFGAAPRVIRLMCALLPPEQTSMQRNQRPRHRHLMSVTPPLRQQAPPLLPLTASKSAAALAAPQTRRRLRLPSDLLWSSGA